MTVKTVWYCHSDSHGQDPVFFAVLPVDVITGTIKAFRFGTLHICVKYVSGKWKKKKKLEFSVQDVEDVEDTE
jgi:hypothetical protein